MAGKSQTFWQFIKFWLIWNILVDISLAILFLGYYAAGHALPGLGYDPFAEIYFLLGCVSPFLVGPIQWLAFRRRIKHSYWWILATDFGWLSVIFVYINLFDWVSRHQIESELLLIAILFLVNAIVGAWIGLLQWLVLRGKVPSSGLWLLGSIVGWASAGMSFYVLWQIGMEEMGAFIGLTSMGMITGVVYAYLFTQPSKMRLA